MEYFSFLPRYLHKQFRSTFQPLKQKIAFLEYVRGTFYSLPLQLLFLHFRKYQVLLLFWVVLFATVGGAFMKSFGAEALFLAPEYMGDVNALSTALVGVAIGIFIMCWNVTTFILFSRHFTFLAATQYPFLKYCINNSAIPLSFLIFYLIKAYEYLRTRELIDNVEIAIITGGFLIGLLLVLTISFFYFFSADRTIFKILQPLFSSAKNYISHLQPEKNGGRSLIHSEWFLDSFYRVRRCRDVSHYSQELMEKIFKRHHFAAVLSIFVVYLFLLVVGFFIDYPFFQFPAGASVTLLFAILIGVTGAIVYFFQSWSVPALLLFLFILNALYQVEWIDPRNKAYGLNYGNEKSYPSYTQQNIDSIAASPAADGDKKNMEAILGRWKEKQGEEKPLLVVVTTSGGGNRSATFTMNVLQRLDSLTGGTMLKKTFLFTGASGGMIGATYFRELYRMRQKNRSLNLQSGEYVDNIASDLLNPIFTSFVSTDVFAPERKFSVGPYTYLRDRGLAFEQALNHNTDKVLDKKLGDYAADERNAAIPLMLYHTLVTRDGKKMHIGTQPMRFMMQPLPDTSGNMDPAADAIDFASFFAKQDPYNLRMLTVLRMNATFPVVLPNVWMPTEPVIDVMDGGLRDNFGVETSMRFLSHLQAWIKENTRGVLLVQIRDRMDGGWENPYEFDDLMQNATKPFFLLQHNWYKMMEYYQKDMATYFSGNSRFPLHNITFQYIPRKEEHKAALSFHLTKQEKKDIAGSLQSKHNQESFRRVLALLEATNKSAGNNP